MAGEAAKTKVNSWNEWNPLKHVIVGVADGCCIPPPEPALDAKARRFRYARHVESPSGRNRDQGQ